MTGIFGRIFAVLALLVATAPAMAQGEYTVRTGDTLTVEVLQDASLNRSVLVLPDGRISFPTVGTLRASGRTIAQIQQALSAGLATNFVAPPDVFVGVTPGERPEALAAAPVAPPEPETISIYLLGEVAAPGPKELELGIRLLQALSTSGGFTDFAATKRVQLRRTDPMTGVQSVYQINYNALANGAQLTSDVPLIDGDVILVPERRLFE